MSKNGNRNIIVVSLVAESAEKTNEEIERKPLEKLSKKGRKPIRLG